MKAILLSRHLKRQISIADVRPRTGQYTDVIERFEYSCVLPCPLVSGCAWKLFALHQPRFAVLRQQAKQWAKMQIVSVGDPPIILALFVASSPGTLFSCLRGGQSGGCNCVKSDDCRICTRLRLENPLPAATILTCAADPLLRHNDRV